MSLTGKRVDELTALTTPLHDDLLYIMHDPDDTKLHRQIQIGSLREYFNVKDYGAIGDGVTDDTEAIQAALTAAAAAAAAGARSTVHMPAGDYAVTDTFTPTVALTISGDGPSRTRFITDGLPYKGGELTPLITAGALDGLEFRDFAVWRVADDALQNGHIRLTASTRARFSRLHFYHSGSIKLYGVVDFRIDSISAVCNNDSVVSMFSSGGTRSSDGLITNISAEEVAEPIDFAATDRVMVRGLRCYGEYSGSTNEAIDIGGSTGIMISDAIIEGAWPRGIYLKSESATPLVDITLQNVRLRGEMLYGILMRSTDIVAPQENIQLLDCDVELDPTASSVAIYSESTYVVDGLTIRGGRYLAKTRGIDLFVTTAVKRHICIDGVEIGNCSDIGLKVLNARELTVRDCYIHDCGTSAIRCDWSVIGALDTTAKMVNCTIEGNRLVNWGQGATSQRAINIRIESGIEAAETYRGLRVCGNELIQDGATTATTPIGISVTKGDLTAWDYCKLDDNLYICVTAPTSYSGVFGVNTTEDNNTIAP